MVMYCTGQLHPRLLLHSSLYRIAHFNSLLCKKIHLGSCYTLHAFLSYQEIGFPWVEEITQLLPLSSSKRAMHCTWDVHLAGSLIHASPYKFCLKNCTQTKCQTWLKNQYFATWEHYTCIKTAGALHQLGLTPNTNNVSECLNKMQNDGVLVTCMRIYCVLLHCAICQFLSHQTRCGRIIKCNPFR